MSWAQGRLTAYQVEMLQKMGFSENFSWTSAPPTTVPFLWPSSLKALSVLALYFAFSSSLLTPHPLGFCVIRATETHLVKITNFILLNSIAASLSSPYLTSKVFNTVAHPSFLPCFIGWSLFSSAGFSVNLSILEVPRSQPCVGPAPFFIFSLCDVIQSRNFKYHLYATLYILSSPLWSGAHCKADISS